MLVMSKFPENSILNRLPTLFSILLMTSPAFSQEKADDILMVSVGESSDRYSEVAVHLQGLLAGTAGWEDSSVDILEDSDIESLADGFYDPNPEDIALRAQVVEGYNSVVLIPTLSQTPTGTIEYREFGGGPTNVYDDPPFDNEYFAPEVFYEGSTQLAKLILNAGSTPLLFLPQNSDEALTDYGPVMYRVANGVGLQMVPGAYAVAAASNPTQLEIDYLYACSLYTQLTGLNANAANYSPANIPSANATALANTAETTVNLQETATHYTTSYKEEGAVVCRSLDITSAPFNNVIRYFYKGTSTQDFTRDALNKIIDSNPAASSASRKLGTRNGVYSPGVRYWHPDDLTPEAGQVGKFSLEPNQAAFMFVSGSFSGADAQTVIDLDQENMVPMAFDWIKSFLIEPRVSGTASTADALDFHSCLELYFNYAERGWKLIPLTIGMGRINEVVPNFVASDDAIHSSDPLLYMNAYMMLTSALGTQPPLPTNITAADIHRGTYTTEQIQQACLIGYDVITELANLSETGDFVPDSDLAITTTDLPAVPVGEPFSFQLSAAGGDGTFAWEIIADTALPEGLSLSNSGLLSGTVTEGQGTRSIAFQVTDGAGSFRKAGLNLTTPLPVGDTTTTVDIRAERNTNYGTDAIATMFSEVQTAPDGLATFRIAISVDPKEGTAINSDGAPLWGINSGEGNTTLWTTFEGTQSESVDSIADIRVVDFNPNGGSLTTDIFTDLSFTTITVRNGANARDRVKVTAGGVENSPGGVTLPSDPAIIDLQGLAGTPIVSSFSLANGNIGNSRDRWNVESVGVEYTTRIVPVDEPADEYATWAASFGLTGNDALPDADSESGGAGDGYTNLIEFALGMDPTLFDAGSKEADFSEEVDGSHYFVYQYERRTNHLTLGLTYSLIETVDLVTPSATPPTEVIVGDAVDGFETVTTRYLIGEPTKFVQLMVELDSP